MLFVLAVLAACGGSSGPSVPEFPRVIPLGSGDVSPQIVNHTLAVGDNRFSLGLLDKNSDPILGAPVHLRFFDLHDDQPVLKSEVDPRFVPVELSFIDESSGGQKRVVGENGVYVAPVSFDRAGRWGLEASVTRDGRQLEPALFQFDVQEKTPEPAIGDPAPASRQLTTKDVADVAEIDSSYPLRPQMHDITVADALAAGKPIVLAFATPAFCESRTCGPVMDTVMDPLYQKYKDQAVFIHIEPYQLQELRAGIDRIPVPATEEWGLQTEPWVFVIDRQGMIAAKFEGITGLDEVEATLAKVLAQG
ncbi:MAG: hypothetical protein HYY03_01815 [Chloroflexi bacterium]|nr:hypothetical protein [Chloroflexota bacterium]